MKTHIIEVTNNNLNWGKFLLGVFDDAEKHHTSRITNGYLLREIGWDLSRTIWVLDLQTHEGASFCLGGRPHADLDKHKIWVCPMFEPFLNWLYKQDREKVMALDLPHFLDLPDAEFSMYGYRRAGKDL